MMETKEPPNGGFGWVVVFAAFMQLAIGLGVAFTVGVYYPYFQDTFNSDSSTTAWVAAAHLAMLSGGGPLAGWLVNKIGTASVAFIGSLITGLGCIAAGYSNTILLVILCLGVIAGFGTCLLSMSAMTAVSRWFSSRRSLATGIALSGVGIGVFGFAPLIRILLNVYGRNGALLIEAGLALQVCVFALLLRPVPPNNSKRSAAELNTSRLECSSQLVYPPVTPQQDKSEKSAQLSKKEVLKDDQNVVSEPMTFLTVFKSKIFCIFCASQFLTFLSASGPLVFLYNRAVKDLALDTMEASYIVSIMGITNTLGRLLFGALGNRFPNQRVLLTSGTVIAYGIATALSVLDDSFISIAVYAAVFGAGYGGMFTLTPVLLVDFFGIQLFGVTYGNVGLSRGLACAIGPPFGGWLISVTGGNHTYMFVLQGLLGFIGGVVLLLIPMCKWQKCRYDTRSAKRF